MKIIKTVSQGEVFGHWEMVEKISIFQRSDLVFPLVAYNDLQWHLSEIERKDINKIYICSTDDWSVDGLCVPDFRLTTALTNYKNSAHTEGKYRNIKEKEEIFKKDLKGLDTRIILVAENNVGPYTIIEGCKRSVALAQLEKLEGISVYLGISPSIKTYIWSRYTGLE